VLTSESIGAEVLRRLRAAAKWILTLVVGLIVVWLVLTGLWGWLPAWIPALIVAWPTVLLWRADRRAGRRSSGACASCGYNRRGLVGADAACPECGSKP
jgi:hypothetical protein